MPATQVTPNALKDSKIQIKGYNENEDLLKVSSIQKRMRDDFLLAGGLDASKWDVSIGAGMTLSATNGLVITSGKTVNSVTTVTSKDVFTIPMRLSVGVTISLRIVNQVFWVELISVDPVTLNPDGQSVAAWKFDATTANYNQYRVGNSGVVQDSGYSSTTTTAGNGYFEIEPFTDECWFHSNAVDSAAARAASFRRNTKCPDPNALYKIRIRVVNGGAAPTFSTTLTVPFVVIDDYAEVMAEISAGRGQGSAGQSLGVQINGTALVTFAYPQVAVDTNTSLGANGSWLSSFKDAFPGINSNKDFVATAWADQAGILTLYASTDNTTYRAMKSVNVLAGSSSDIVAPVAGMRYFKLGYQNGPAAQTGFVVSSRFRLF